MAAMLLVLVVTSAALATRAVARALPAGAQQAASGGISTNNDAIPAAPPATRSSTHWRGLQRLLLSLEEENSKAGHSCVSGDPNNGCP